MKRRTFIVAAAAMSISQRSVAQADSSDPFDTILAGLSNEEILATRTARELGSRQIVVTESQGQRRRARSRLPISQRATDLIIHFEVISERYYSGNLEAPIWPGGNSGVTIGIGYDMGFVTPDLFASDWGNRLDSQHRDLLARASGLTGARAQNALSQFKQARVPWRAARAQFEDFLPYIVAETHEAFPNLDKLTPDARGALVSLVYNRGGSTSNTQRRKEMYQIRQLMLAGDYLSDAIPRLILDMKRLWIGKGLDGLLRRRELEAELFSQGTPKS